MYTSEQNSTLQSIIATRDLLASKYKTDLIAQLGRLVATISPTRKTKVSLKNGTALVSVDFMQELIQDRVTFHEVAPDGTEGKRIPYKDIPLADVERLFKQLSKIS